MSLDLANLAAFRVVELPRRRTRAGESGGDVGRRQRLAAVAAAYHSGATLMLGWYRAGAGNAMHVFASGAITGVPDPRGRTPLSLPPGALGTAYPPGALARMLDDIPQWTVVNAVSDGLLAEDRAARPDELRPSLDDCLLRVWHSGFGWLLVAEPVPAADIAAWAREVAAQEREARAKSSSPDHAVRAARLENRHRELRLGESSGMWSIRLLAGGSGPAEAAAVAGLLSASADLSHLPYLLAPEPGAGPFAAALARPGWSVSSLLVASLAVGPAQEVPGVRLALRPEFDVTPESIVDSAQRTVVLGTVLDQNGMPGEGLCVPLSSLNRHTFVCGATGGGKSQTVRHLLEQATAAGVPWLVVEPAKAEYRQMVDRLDGEVIVVRPGNTETAPAGFNPLAPAPGFALQTHADLVRALFLAAFEADEPFPQVLSAALTRCYEELGWDLALGEPRVPGTRPRYPMLADLQAAAERVVDEIGYGREVTDNVRGFIRVRIASLRFGTTGRVFEGGHPIDFGELMRRNVVFEIEDVGDDRDKAFLMGGLLIQLVEHLRVRARTDPGAIGSELRHLTVFEEAHRLLRRSETPGPGAHAVELFAGLLAEIRAYGEGLVIAEQIPSKLVPDVIKNTAVKVMHRLPAMDDRTAVGATVNLTESQSEYLVTLPPGTGAAFADGMDQPLLVRMPDGTGRERGGRTPVAPPAGIVGRRSTTCGARCREDACTLRDMRGAARVLETERWFVLWAELAVVGHLTGWPVPALRAEHLRLLWTVPDRLLSCALSHAVDDAVAVRSAVLTPSCAPDELAVHVVGALAGQLKGESLCDPEELGYLARPYRWHRLWDELNAIDLDAPHPRTAEWEKTYGRDLPGVGTAAQAALVRTWLDADQRDPATLAVVSFGARRPSALERAMDAAFGAAEWESRLGTEVTEHFAGTTWPMAGLARRGAVVLDGPRDG